MDSQRHNSDPNRRHRRQRHTIDRNLFIISEIERNRKETPQFSVTNLRKPWMAKFEWKLCICAQVWAAQICICVLIWHKLWSLNHKIGHFLRHTPIVRVIGNSLFVHAGLTPEIILQIISETKSESIISAINKSVRNGLTNPYTFELNINNEIYSVLTGKNGPLWTREFDTNTQNTKHICTQLSKTLQKLNVTRMIIGHSNQTNGIPQSLCDGKLWSIDVGISCVYGCHLGALKIDLLSDVVSVLSPFVTSFHES